MFPKNDFFAFFLSFLIIVIHYFGSKWISKFIDPTTRRTLTHIGGGLWAVMWFFYETRYVATVFLIIVVIFFILAPKDYKNLFSYGDEKHIGLITYGIGLIIVTYFFFNTSYGAAAVFSLALGDGLGDFIGKRIGSHRYKFPWMKGRSIEGSLAVFFGAFIAGILTNIFFSPPLSLSKIILNAILVSIIEALSPSHLDNVFIPIGSAFFLYYF